jgi:hypothetical protein
VLQETSVWGLTTATGKAVAGAPDGTIFSDPVPRPGEQSKLHSKLHCPLATLKLCDLPLPIPLSLRIILVEGTPEVVVTVVRVPAAGARVVGGDVEGVAEVHAAATAPGANTKRMMSSRLILLVEGSST